MEKQTTHFLPKVNFTFGFFLSLLKQTTTMPALKHETGKPALTMTYNKLKIILSQKDARQNKSIPA